MSDDEFWLAPDALRYQAEVFDTYADFAVEAREWLRNHPLRDVGSFPAYGDAARYAEELRLSLVDWFDHLAHVLGGVYTELTAVAAEGESIDADEAAMIDAAHPAVYNDHTSSSSEVAADNADGRTDRIQPRWGPPGGGIAFFCDSNGTFDNLNQLSARLVPDDLFSPTQWLDTVLGWMGARSVPERTLDEFGGRWGDLRAFAFTLRGLSGAVENTRGHLASAVAYIGQAWQGYAASSAQDYFAELLEVLSRAESELADAGDAFDDYATGVEQTAEAVSGLVYGIYDAAIIAVAAAAIGTVTIETIAGGAAGWGVAGLAVWRGAALASEVNDRYQDLRDLITILEAISHLASDMSDFTSELPVPAMEQTA